MYSTWLRLLVLISCLCAFGCLAKDLIPGCAPLPPHTPKDIHDVRPDDIKVVMAVGDSITAAFGLEGLAGGLNEFRGQSWSIGGDSGAVTLPNYLKQFSPAVQGMAMGSHLVELCYGVLCPPFQYHQQIDRFDAAQSGAMVEDLPVHELDYLIKELKANKNISMENDWKVMTLFIGANDLCASCQFIEKGFLDPEDFGKHLMATMQRVRSSIPKVFVNIVGIFNISQVYNLSLKKKSCATLHRDLFIECDCVFSPLANKTRTKVDIYAQAYNQKAREIAAYYNTQNLTDFAVVFQPFGTDAKLSQFDISFLSDLDCFHPSKSAHQIMATALWNSMLTPTSRKKTSIDVTDTPICPTSSSYLFTN